MRDAMRRVKIRGVDVDDIFFFLAQVVKLGHCIFPPAGAIVNGKYLFVMKERIHSIIPE